MKISINWLRELVDAPLDAEEVARALTRAGLEVEGRQAFGALSGVVVAEVRGRRPHPNAAKLTLVDVFDGRVTTQVVCGAPNVPDPQAGARVLWARPGATLPSGITLAEKEVRGVVSPGMLCAEDELGFGSSHEGIIVLGREDGLEPGDDLAQKLGLPDVILELNVTPNRPDCLGHLGVARELCALLGVALKPLPPRLREPEGGPAAQVELTDPEGCPRYTALVLDGVKVGPSPFKERLRLLSLGMRPISNVVDATNLVMLETGQPLHAFDLDRLAGQRIVVRRAREGEKLATLDGQERTLKADDVAICDAERPVAVAGVMGGADSEVTASTTRLLLESAYFDPARVRRTARRLGLHTEASHRFERGVDPALAAGASLRCAQRLVELSGARPASRLTDVYPKALAPWPVTLRPARVRALLGTEVSDDEQARILAALGLEVGRGQGGFVVTVPTRRPDLTREVDLIEEIARVHGYDRVPATVPTLRTVPGALRTPRGRLADAAREALRGQGFDEVVTYAFGAPGVYDAFAAEPRVRLENPLREELSVMRTSLVPNLVLVLKRNLERGQADVRVFEVGETFHPREGTPLPDERTRACVLWSGHAEGWLRPGAEVDFFDLKGVCEELGAALGHALEVEAGDAPWLHPGVQARVRAGGRVVGVLGEVHPDLLGRLDVGARAFVLELELSALPEPAPPCMAELPRYPAIVRDLSFFVDEGRSAREIRDAIFALKDPLCVEVRVLEDYREPGKVPAGKKGMLWSFTYRAGGRTLTDAEVQTLHEGLAARLLERLGATRR